jgi:CheY-like chemotaxis protein
MGGRPTHQRATMEPSSLRILVVDSKGSSRSSVCSLLRDCAYQVRAARGAVSGGREEARGGRR